MSKDSYRPVECVVFDVFGTLGGWSTKHEFDPTLAILEHARRPVNANGLRELFEVGPSEVARATQDSFRNAARAAWQEAMDLAGVPTEQRGCVTSSIERTLADRRFLLYRDAFEVLTFLTMEGVEWCVCSNMSPDTEAKFRSSLPAGVEPLYSAVSWRIGARKPHIAIYEDVIRHLPCPVGDAIFVGDRRDCDVDAPQRLGFQVALVTRDNAATGAGVEWGNLHPIRDIVVLRRKATSDAE